MALYIEKIKLADNSNDESGIIVYLINGVRYSRAEAVALSNTNLIKSNKSPFPRVERVFGNGYYYLRTVKDGTTSDNLLSLPRL